MEDEFTEALEALIQRFKGRLPADTIISLLEDAAVMVEADEDDDEVA